VKHSASRTSRTPARCAVSEPSPASPSSGDQPTQTVRVRPGERPLRLNALQRWLLGRLRRSLERLSPGNVPNLLRSAVARARGAPADPPPLDDDYLDSVLLPESDEWPFLSPALRRVLRDAPAQPAKGVYTSDPSRTFWEQLILWAGVVLVALAVLRVLWLFISAILGISLSLIVIAVVTVFVFVAFTVLG
jgi:hypothetical protein